MAIPTQIIRTVAGNTAPAFALTAKRGGVVIDVTGATVSLIITNKAGTVTNTGHQTCTLTTPASGLVSYTRLAADVPSKGSYKCDLKIVYATGGIEILYDLLKIIARDPVDA